MCASSLPLNTDPGSFLRWFCIFRQVKTVRCLHLPIVKLQEPFGPAQRGQLESVFNPRARLALQPAPTCRKVHTEHVAALAVPGERMGAFKQIRVTLADSRVI